MNDMGKEFCEQNVNEGESISGNISSKTNNIISLSALSTDETCADSCERSLNEKILPEDVTENGNALKPLIDIEEKTILVDEQQCNSMNKKAKCRLVSSTLTNNEKHIEVNTSNSAIKQKKN
jgi:hypothetical protein